MRYAYTAASIRAAERPLLDAGKPLMRHAARTLAHRIKAWRQRHARDSQVLVLVGGGNNGGDGLWCAHDLAQWGIPVSILLATDHPHAEGWAAACRAGVPTVECSHAADFQIWVDALTGIGIRGPLRGVLAHLVEDLAALRSPHTRVFAVDTPCALADDPRVTVPLPADETLTFGAPTPALVLPPAAAAVGTLLCAPLGIPFAHEDAAVTILTEADLAALWPRARHDDHKYTRGVVGIYAGSTTYPGAGVLATRAALAAAPGMIRYLGPAAVADRIGVKMPEVVTAPGRIQAALVGSGMPTDEVDRTTLAALCRQSTPVVLDAGALDKQLIAEVTGESAAETPCLVLTPHAGELAHLLECERTEVEADPVGAARALATQTGAVVVAKGPHTVVVGPAGPVVTLAPSLIYDSATSWLATAGSGDVLAGIIAAVVAQFAARRENGEQVLPLTEQVGLAVLLHTLAATGPLRASALAESAEQVLARHLLDSGSTTSRPTSSGLMNSDSTSVGPGSATIKL